MAIELARAVPLLVTVHGVSHGQMIINNFGYRAADALAVSAGSSSGVFLDNFMAHWRTFVLPIMYPAYSVYRYWVRTIIGAVVIPNTAPVQYKPVFGVFEDFKAGVTSLDDGEKVVVGDYLPEFIAATCTRVHSSMGRRYWRSSVRIGPHVEADQGTLPNEFNTARLDELNIAMDSFKNANIEDGLGATNDWVHATFSPTYYGRVLLGIGDLRLATNPVVDYTVGKIVTTQRSRKVRSSAGS